ncbi:MAG TPA: AraC family transcriptional regulator [Brevundimonas sp.]|jgi:AraC-like DNA-binding protein|uniref:helix-turn-helix domain-containing protein n=1 Tax=Brevundimonas sp. TaxID=1871086 RepID=UPI002DE8B872|nr:AraC family transcriptional regulator [Brevundimonas sp.]
MLEGLVFGWRTAVLVTATAVVLPVALGLWFSFHDRRAARTLAALLVVLVGVFTPWTIGFAGFYDRWPWLTFLPVANALWAAPLLWLYACALTTGGWPARWWVHLLPGAAQFVWQAAAFILPLSLKGRWSDLTSPVSELVVAVGLAVGFIGYGWATARVLSRHRRRLARSRSDDAGFAAGWLDRVTVAGAALGVFWVTYETWDAVRPLGYRGLMGLYLGVAAMAVYLAVEGWRQTRTPWPRPEVDAPDAGAPARDWRAQGRVWAERVRAEGWHRQPDLTLSGLARKLGTNAGYLSRAVNEGLGVNFSTFVNDLRSDEVAERLLAGSDEGVLDLALEAGFASKASFNRAFLARHGVTPRQMRARARRPES